MSIEHGHTSPLWMAKAVIQHAPAALVRVAVGEVLDHLWYSDHLCSAEIMDRLVQVAASGKFTPPEEGYHSDEDYFIGEGFSPEPWTEENEEAVRKFREQLDGMPEAEEGEE